MYEFGLTVVPAGNFHFIGNNISSVKYTFDRSNKAFDVLNNSIPSSLSEYSSFSKSVLYAKNSLITKLPTVGKFVAALTVWYSCSALCGENCPAVAFPAY